MRADKAYDELLRRVREETLLTTIDASRPPDEVSAAIFAALTPSASNPSG